MAGLNIGDVFMKVLADMTGFEADVKKQAGKAADSAGKTFGDRMRKGMTVGLSAVGAAGGLLFGVAARGAAELTDAMAAFQAETGATQAELESARKSVLELSKSNIQSFDEIARTQAALRTQMGLTQEQAEATTEAFLNFSTATGQEATEAVQSFDDILDSWGLTADNAAGLMDKLIVSHQKYGGVIADNEKTLAALAPSMKAANFQIDDGIALLNLFGAKGIDAMTASAAFSKALTKVKSPAELQRLITDIANTEDPFLRASKAADLFGARAGAKLANALAGADLDDYKVSMEEAAGATDKAAAAIENTPFNQLKMALRAIAAPAIEAGQSFGPLILALSQLGGGKLVAAVTTALGGLAGALASKVGAVGAKIGGKLGDAIAKSAIADKLAMGLFDLAGNSKVSGAVEGAGKLLGGRFGIAFQLAAVVGIAAIADTIQPQLREMSKKLHDAIFQGPLEGVGDALEGAGDWINNLPWPLGPKGAPDWAKTSAQAAADAAGVGQAVGEGVGVGIKQSQGEISHAVGTAVSTAGAAKKAYTGGEMIGNRMMRGFYDGVIEKQSLVKTAIDAARNLAETTMSQTNEVAYLVGVLTSEELAKGVNDGRANVAAAWKATRDAAYDRLKTIVNSSGVVGKGAMDALANGAKSKIPAVRTATAQVRQTIATEIKKPAGGRPAGQKVGNDVIAGLNDKKGPVGRAAYQLGVAAAKYVLNGVTFVRNSEVGGADRHSGHPVKGSATGNYLSAYEPSIVGERRPELFVPDVPGQVYRTVQQGLAALGQPSSSSVVNLQTYGLPLKAETPMDVASALRRVQTLGSVTTRPRLSWRPS